MRNLSTLKIAHDKQECSELTFQRGLGEATMRGDFSKKEIHEGR